ncbi:glycoside hydrolase family 95-like protein [Parabacteroides goldsteinii]|uniref:glycosyl hydrolase family 95 catalytic domain-containing protein n=1 Tax=Parabacteroides goldsteinii TaxID=328812 RepID=UPI0026DABD1D|nr:hypothetical protein [Parabacteroides goldsteinii]
MKNYRTTAILIGCLINIYCINASISNFDNKYKKVLEKYSIYTDSVINDYYSSGLIGNGLLGASVYKQQGDTLCWELGRTDVCDHRKENYSILYTDCRLPIGKFLVPMAKGSSSMLTDLYKCEVSGRIKNIDGTVSWRTLTPAEHNVFIIELEGENIPEIIFKPEQSISPRYTYKDQAYRNNDFLVGYTANPDPIVYTKNEFSICKQPLLAGGEYTTVWTISNRKNKKVLIASIACSQVHTDTEKEAINNIKTVQKETLKKVEKRHLKWWHTFYSKSYVSVPEDRYNAFFWSQLYKLGSATRSNRYPIDLMGPWFHNETPWPAIWWNLNIQLTYSPMFTINHSELSIPLLKMLDDNVENLKRNVPALCPYPAIAIGRSSTYNCKRTVEKEHGLLLWTLFYYWKYCSYTMDDTRLKEKLFPLLKLSINYYRYLLFKGEDKYLHLPSSHSPEYADTEDCNFELSLLRWGCETLIKTDKRFTINDPLLPEWENILNNLVPYPADQDGFLIGKNTKLKSGHRHYSHLLMLYPLQNFPLTTAENIEIAKKSINYWLGFKNAYYCGYTYTGASSMSTLMGEGNRAYNYLNIFFDKYMTPNTLYKEAGPVFETPMSALASFTEMLLSSNNETIRIMPAIPDTWKNIKFDNLLAEGGFEVSAQRSNGLTENISLKSLYGGKCKVYCDIPDKERKIETSKTVTIQTGENNSLILSIPKGETVTIIRK